MLSRQQAARGRTVYGNGATGPNTGRVSAQGIQGYVNREQRNLGNSAGISRFGGDGQSDTRSGLAAKALKRQSSFVRPNGQGSGHHNNSQGNSHWQPGNQSNGASSSGGGAAGPAAGAATTPPEVSVTDTGTLQLPYDDQWSSDVIGAMGDYNSQILDLQQQQQQQALDYMNQNNNLGREYEQTQRDTLNLGAGAGTAFSSAYGTAVSKNALNNQNAHNELDAQNSLFNQNVNQQKLAIQQAFNDLLRQDALTRAANASQDAGSLGYGQSGQGSSGSGSGSSGSGSGHGGGKKDKDKKKNTGASWKPANVRTPYNNTGRTDLAKKAMKKK